MPTKQASRFKSQFGIPVPPFKYYLLEAGANTLTFVIRSKKIPSKKNHGIAYAVRKDAIKMVNDIFAKKGSITQKEAISAIHEVYGKFKTNKFYDGFLKEQKPVLQEQMQHYSQLFGEKGLVFPLKKCKVQMYFYFKDDYIQDSMNKAQTVSDILTAAGIIEDDNYKVLPDIVLRGACFKDEIVDNYCIIKVMINLRSDEKT